MFETFDHTADLGLRIRARSFEDLLSEAARALLATLVDNPDDVRSVEERQVHVAGESADYLLFDWLSELLYRFETEHWLTSGVSITRTTDGFDAVIQGETFDPARHRGAHEVKAVTYHGLSVEESPNGWQAEVIVDI